MKMRMKKIISLVLTLSVTLGTSGCRQDMGTFVDPSSIKDYNNTPLKVRAVDDNTLKVKLNAPCAYFLELTAFPTYFPVKKEVVDKYGDSWAVKPKSYISTGPFRMKDYVLDSKIVFEKNPFYWDAQSTVPDKLSFMLTDNTTSQFDSYQKGTLQFIDEIPVNEIDGLMNRPDFVLSPVWQVDYVTFNNQTAPFNNAKVREAFSLAIDRTYITKTINKGATPAGAWVAPKVFEPDGREFRTVGGDFIDPSENAYAANLAKAKEILAEAGYPDGKGLPTIDYLYTERKTGKLVGEALQMMWSKLGANVTLSATEWTTMLTSRKSGRYTVAMDAWTYDFSDPIGVLDMFTSNSGNNDSQYRNPDYDALIKQIKSEPDNEKRFVLMHQAEKILMENYVFAPFDYQVDYYLVKENLKDSIWADPMMWKFFRLANKKDLAVCVGPNPKTLDPSLTSTVDSGIIIMNCFDGLFRWNKENKLEPALAESYELSPDGTEYTFHLKPNLKFSDGSPLTAKDFVYSWNRAVDPNTGSDYSYMFDVVSGYDEIVGG
jgi:oligopeptide transport system substrate-binding protein